MTACARALCITVITLPGLATHPNNLHLVDALDGGHIRTKPQQAREKPPTKSARAR